MVCIIMRQKRALFDAVYFTDTVLGTCGTAQGQAEPSWRESPLFFFSLSSSSLPLVWSGRGRASQDPGFQIGAARVENVHPKEEGTLLPLALPARPPVRRPALLQVLVAFFDTLVSRSQITQGRPRTAPHRTAPSFVFFLFSPVPHHTICACLKREHLTASHRPPALAYLGPAPFPQVPRATF